MLIGVTGGIGCGKSFVCKLLRERGFDIYSCDESARRIMTEDEAVIRDIKNLIGDDAYAADGSLNKKVIASFLFASSDNASRVNKIVHPAVKADILRWYGSFGAQPSKLNVQTTDSSEAVPKDLTTRLKFVECAILYEAKFQSIMDKVVFVSAPESVRMERVKERDGITESGVRSRMKQQMDDAEKEAMSDHVLLNDGVSDVSLELDKLLHKLSLTSR